MRQPVFLSGPTYTFTAADAGVHVFAAANGVKFGTAGTFTLAARDGTVGGTSNAVTVKSSQVVSATTVMATPAAAFLFNAVTVTASAASATQAVPTGTVRFFDGGVAIGSATLVAGKATLTQAFSTVGTHSVTAAYGGDANTLGSTSAVAPLLIADFSISPAAGTTAAAVLPGNAATYTLVVTPVGASAFPSAISFAVSGLPTGATYSSPFAREHRCRCACIHAGPHHSGSTGRRAPPGSQAALGSSGEGRAHWLRTSAPAFCLARAPSRPAPGLCLAGGNANDGGPHRLSFRSS